jgi:hypothetical protein
VITWRDVTANHCTADVRLRGMAVARLHARPERWSIELLDGCIDGPSGSLGQSRRAALQAMAQLLPELDLALQAALRGA